MSKGLLLKSSGIVKSTTVKLVGNYMELFKQGFVVGIGWSIGVTFGFVVISSIIVFILNSLGGLPFIGSWIADIVEVTKDQLVRRSVISPIR